MQHLIYEPLLEERLHRTAAFGEAIWLDTRHTAPPTDFLLQHHFNGAKTTPEVGRGLR